MTSLEKSMSKMRGWQDLIQKTNKKLKALNDPRLEFFPYQKYASLRYNTGIYSSDAIEKIIDDAEEKSEYICIVCGRSKDDTEEILCKDCLTEFRGEGYEQ